MAQRKLAHEQKRGRPGLMTDLLLIACVVVIVLNEVFIHLSDGIPTSEPPNAVGQWGPWVAVIMALAGSALVEYHRPAWEEWQRVLREEGVLVKAEKNPSLVPSLWMRLSNVGGKSPATESGPSRSSLAKGIAYFSRIRNSQFSMFSPCTQSLLDRIELTPYFTDHALYRHQSRSHRRYTARNPPHQP